MAGQLVKISYIPSLETNKGMTISIIIPVFNTETYLPACLDSILAQDFTDYEVLLVDDGSKDGSGAICDEYAAKDSRFRVIHKENGGVSSARNLALEEAKGEWICFIDSDDQLVPEGLQVLIGGISDQVDMVVAGFIDTTLPLKEIKPVQGERMTIGRNEAMVPMFNNPDRKFDGYVFAKLFRREVIVKERIAFDPAITIKEDTLFVVMYLCKSDRIVSVCSTPCYYYIQRSSSAMGSLKDVYNPKYLTSFEAIVQINRLVESTFPDDRKLLFISRDELMNRLYRIKDHMIRHHALDKGILSSLRKRAFWEVGVVHYLDYQFRRNRRRANRIINKVFKTHFNVQ